MALPKGRLIDNAKWKPLRHAGSMCSVASLDNSAETQSKIMKPTCSTPGRVRSALGDCLALLQPKTVTNECWYLEKAEFTWKATSKERTLSTAVTKPTFLMTSHSLLAPETSTAWDPSSISIPGRSLGKL